MTSSTLLVRPSSRSTPVSPRWFAAVVAAAVAVVAEVAGAVAVVVAVAAEVVAGAAETAPLLVTAAGRQSHP